ncbi:MAG: ParB/RepB/Spo0J family partition protein, partial [Opitutales bacterium]|nr:ParB/RepB/Spo0J family partition protein [Opitutales bacterium]
LIAGERRWRAFQHLKLKAIPARIVEASNASAAALGLIENLQREGLNPIEEAHGYASLIRDFDLTQEIAADRVGKARATVANTLRLLALDAEIQGFIAKGLLSVGHAKVLLGITDPAQRAVLARRVIEGELHRQRGEREGGCHVCALAAAAPPRTPQPWRASRRNFPPISAPGWPCSMRPKKAALSLNIMAMRIFSDCWRSSVSRPEPRPSAVTRRCFRTLACARRPVAGRNHMIDNSRARLIFCPFT